MRDASPPFSPVFGVRRDGEPVATSASDLLITIFGELMRPNGGSAWTQTLVEALRLVGISEKAARQAVSRLADKGWLTSERVGRKTRWSLTPWATDLLERGAERIYAHGTAAQPWDRQWLVLLASLPESQRSSRPRLSVRLGWAGFGSISPGVWICPRLDSEAEVVSVLNSFGVETTIFRSELTPHGDPADLARQAWQTDDLATQYTSFLTTIEPLAPSSSAAVAGDLIRLVDAWRRFPLLDPDLPADLLPDDWPGRVAAHAFGQRRATWATVAASWWTTTDADFHSP